jgi:DNA mismatch endonuclease, patch repair protein
MGSSWEHTTAGAHLLGRVTSNTRPELVLRKRLHAMGLRYRLDRRVEGFRPDILFPGPKIAVFVDGCYWHGCPTHGPKDFQGPNAALWWAKMAENRERDRRACASLEAGGWHVIRVWECAIQRDPDQIARDIAADVLQSKKRGARLIEREEKTQPRKDRWESR